jgi:hypothetical protein
MKTIQRTSLLVYNKHRSTIPAVHSPDYLSDWSSCWSVGFCISEATESIASESWSEDLALSAKEYL